MIHCKCSSFDCDSSISLELPNDIRSPFLDLIVDKREKIKAIMQTVGVIRIRITLDNLDYMVEQLNSFKKVLKERQEGRG